LITGCSSGFGLLPAVQFAKGWRCRVRRCSRRRHCWSAACSRRRARATQHRGHRRRRSGQCRGVRRRGDRRVRSYRCPGEQCRSCSFAAIEDRRRPGPAADGDELHGAAAGHARGAATNAGSGWRSSHPGVVGDGFVGLPFTGCTQRASSRSKRWGRRWRWRSLRWASPFRSWNLACRTAIDAKLALTKPSIAFPAPLTPSRPAAMRSPPTILRRSPPLSWQPPERNRRRLESLTALSLNSCTRRGARWTTMPSSHT